MNKLINDLILENLIIVAIYWVCFPKIHALKLNHQCEGVWVETSGKWLGHENRPVMYEISLYKRGPREISHPSAMCGYTEKMTIYEPESISLPDTEYAGTLILAFPAFKLWTINFFFYKPLGLWHFVTAAITNQVALGTKTRSLTLG